MPSRLVIAVVAFALIIAARPLAAQPGESSPEAVRATIVRIEGDDVFLDVSRAALGNARTLTVYRRVHVRHPLTRKELVDRFAIGELQIVQAGDTLTLARAARPPTHPFAIGDGAETLALAATAPAPAVAAAPAPAPIAAAPAPAAASAATPAASTHSGTTVVVTATAGNTRAPSEADELVHYFQGTLAQSPEYRIRVYEAYLQHSPRSSYRGFVEQELRYLRKLQAGLDAHSADSEDVRRAALLASAVELLPPTRVPADKPFELAVLVRPEANVRGLVLHARAEQDSLFRTLPLQLDGRGHARVRIPADLIHAPRLLFFIEAVNDRGESAAAFASATKPHAIEVPEELVAAERRRDPAMRVRFSSELASFDGTSGRDYFLINEGDFFHRLNNPTLYGIRMGYGRFDGKGGTVQQLDELDQAPQQAGFTYAFFEGELAVSDLVGVALRGTLGLGRPKPGESGEITGGFQTRLRIGDPLQTHLVIGGELIPEIGQRALLHLGWELIDKLPMAAEVQVTDQPVNSDELAVRIIYELGYRVTPRFALALRPSYQLRTIRHAGPGVGLSAAFDW